ncbi:MAG TPA: hypothetical protein PLQ12_08100 [Candidatus Defluviicoccus seviourii]|nr:hypothetical protein [Candidatus Defluviicoccus seviourii]
MTKQTITLVLPQFQHDCPHCRFVGFVAGMDCYTCGDSVVMRFGNHGSDYESLPRKVASDFSSYSKVLAAEEAMVAAGHFAA